MKVHQKPLLLLLMMLFICFYVFSVSGQSISRKPVTTLKKARPSPKPPATVQDLDDQQATTTVEELLAKAGEKTYQRLGTGGGVWAIRKNRPNLKYFQIILAYRAGTLITEVTVVKGNTFRINDAAPELLRLASRLDYAKVGLNRGGDLVVRNEARLKSLDVDELTNNLDKIADAADQVFVEVQKFSSNPK